MKRRADDVRFAGLEVYEYVAAGSPAAHDALGGDFADVSCVRCGHKIGHVFVTSHGPMGGDCLATLTGDDTTRRVARAIVDAIKKGCYGGRRLAHPSVRASTASPGTFVLEARVLERGEWLRRTWTLGFVRAQDLPMAVQLLEQELPAPYAQGYEHHRRPVELDQAARAALDALKTRRPPPTPPPTPGQTTLWNPAEQTELPFADDPDGVDEDEDLPGAFLAPEERRARSMRGEEPYASLWCPFCGERARFDVLDFWPGTREFALEYCCPDYIESWREDLEAGTPEDWKGFFASRVGLPVRSVGGHPEHRREPWDPILDFGITVVPSTTLEERVAGTAEPGALILAEIREYVRRHHRHADAPPAAFTWGYAIYNGAPDFPRYGGDGVPRVTVPKKGQKGGWLPVGLDAFPSTLIGVAMVGTPTARLTIMRWQAEDLFTQGLSPEEVQRRLPRGKGRQPVSLKTIRMWGSELAAGRRAERTADLTRLALNHDLPSFLTYKAASEVYVQTWKDACARGLDGVQTFTLASEAGKSLEYARYKRVGTSKGGQSDRPSRRRAKRTKEQAQPKVRWLRRCAPPGRSAKMPR